MSSKSFMVGAVLSLSLALVGQPASAAIVAGFNSQTLARNDDGSTGSVALPFTVNFFGRTYSNIFVNNNGNLTFSGPRSDFTPVGLGTGYSGTAIIAPFFADVDTRGAGSGVTAYGTGTYEGRQAFGATWDKVGYYSGATDKLNSFQAILVNRSDVAIGDFDIFFRYGSIQWETGGASGGSGGRGGHSASMGFNAGTGNAPGTYYAAPGSLQNGALIDGGANALKDREFKFEVRGGVAEPVTIVPEPASWGMLVLGFGAVAMVARRRRPSPYTMISA